MTSNILTETMRHWTTQTQIKLLIAEGPDCFDQGLTVIDDQLKKSTSCYY